MTRLTVAAILATGLAIPLQGLAASAPAEPSDYRTSDYRAPTPATLAGSEVIDTAAARELWESGEAVFIDVLPRAERPPGLPDDTYWRQPVRMAIPGSIWLPNTGYGALSHGMQAYFESGLAKATDGDTDRSVVIYCLRDCWMSWNAARRALAAGYISVYWYPDGTDGWTEAGLPLEQVEPFSTPSAE